MKYALRVAVQTPLRNFVFPSGKNARSHASRELVHVSCVIDLKLKAEARKSNSNFTMFARQNFGREKFFDFSSILQFFQGNMLSLVILFAEHSFGKKSNVNLMAN